MLLDEELLNNIIIYWPALAPTEDGERLPGTPIELPGYWTETQSRTNTATTKEDNHGGTVYLSSEVIIGGWLWRSSAKVSDPAGTGLAQAPATPPQKQQIKDVARTDDIDDEETLWTAQI